MTHRITRKRLPLVDFRLPIGVKPILQPRRLGRQTGILLGAPEAADAVVRERRVAVREVHEALEPLGFVQLDELFGLFHARC